MAFGEKCQQPGRSSLERREENDLLFWIIPSAGEDGGRWEPWFTAGRCVNCTALLISNTVVFTQLGLCTPWTLAIPLLAIHLGEISAVGKGCSVWG